MQYLIPRISASVTFIATTQLYVDYCIQINRSHIIQSVVALHYYDVMYIIIICIAGCDKCTLIVLLIA